MSGEIRIDYAAVYAQVDELRRMMRIGASDAGMYYDRAQAQLEQMDGATNAELQAVLKLARRAVEVTAEVVEKLLDTIYDSALSMETKEAWIAAQFQAGMRSSMEIGSVGVSVGPPGTFSGASATFSQKITGDLDLARSLMMEGLGEFTPGSVGGSLTQLFNESIPGLASLNTGATLAAMSVAMHAGFADMANWNTGSTLSTGSMATHGGFAGLGAAALPPFAGGNGWPGIGGSSMQGEIGFPSIWPNGSASGLDLQALMGAGATVSISELGIGMASDLSSLNAMVAEMPDFSIDGAGLGVSPGSVSTPGGAGGNIFAGAAAMASMNAFRPPGKTPGASSAVPMPHMQPSGHVPIQGDQASTIRREYTRTNNSVQQFWQAALGKNSNQAATTVNWESIRKILLQPAGDIKEEQFALLAEWFVSLDDVEDLERFLNLLASPLDSQAHIDIVRTFDYVRGNYIAYVICPVKVEGIQRHIETGIAIMLLGQFQLMIDGGSDDLIIDINRERLRLIGRSALLSEVGRLASMTSPSSPLQNILRASHDRLGPFALAEIRRFTNPVLPFQSGFSLTVQHGFANLITHGHSEGRVIEARVNHYLDSRTTFISNALYPEVAGLTIPRIEGLRLELSNQFNATSHIISSIAKTARSAAIAAAWKKTVPLAGASIVLKGAEIASGIPAAEARAESFQRNINDMVEASDLGNFFSSFMLNGVIIAEEGGRNWEVLAWPTHQSYASLRALNYVIETTRNELIPPSGLDPLTELQRQSFYNLPNDFRPITWQEFMVDPIHGFDMFIFIYRYNELRGFHDERWRERYATPLQ